MSRGMVGGVPSLVGDIGDCQLVISPSDDAPEFVAWLVPHDEWAKRKEAAAEVKKANNTALQRRKLERQGK
jgi:hypothetical protein